MSPETDGVRVDFYFNSSDDDKDERLQMARKTLSPKNRPTRIIETTQVESDGVERVTLRAIVDRDRVNMHHAFDSKLNAAFPKGAGAGFVGFFQGPLEEVDNQS